MKPAMLPNIEYTREQAGISCAELTRLLGVSRNTYRNWIVRGNIPGAKLATMAKLLNCSADYLLSGTKWPCMRFYFIGGSDGSTHVITAETIGRAEEIARQSDVHADTIYELQPGVFCNEGFLITQE